MDQPRVPAGSPQGGEWASTKSGGSTGGSVSKGDYNEDRTQMVFDAFRNPPLDNKVRMMWDYQLEAFRPERPRSEQPPGTVDSGMTEAEVLDEYGEYGATAINRDLREGSTLSHVFVRQMDLLFEKANSLPEPVLTYRGLKQRSGETSKDMLKRVFGTDEITPGMEYIDKGFSSTTVNQPMAEQFRTGGLFPPGKHGPKTGLTLKIEVPKGTKALVPRRKEGELLLQRGTRFRVKKFEHVDGIMNLHVEVVP